MSISGLIIFAVANLTVLGLAVYCFAKVFRMPAEHMQAPIKIDTGEFEKFEDFPDNNQASKS
ncbi:hypothetical protein HS125_07685 [bacterium]|nr:hypothetical protein [bacterium]